MPKKVAADLRTPGSVIYSVLVPGKGYMKIAYGQPEYYDNLPRASASFKTYAEAEAFRERGKHLIKVWHERIIKKYGNHMGTGFVSLYDKEAEEKTKLAYDAIVVKITVEECK